MNIIVIGPGAGSVGERVAVVMSIVFKNLFERGLGSDDPRFSKCTWTYLNPAEVLKHCQERDVQKAIFLAVNCTGICP